MRSVRSIRLGAAALGIASLVGCEDSGPQAVTTSAAAGPAAVAPASPTPATFKTPSGKTIKGLQPSPPPGG